MYFNSELRINQYGQYIQEKLGLFRKPRAIEIMIHNFESDPNMKTIEDVKDDLKSTLQHKSPKEGSIQTEVKVDRYN